MANEIKTNLTLTGEDQYTKALKQSYDALKVLKSELKASTAEMGKNATAQDKARLKAQTLKKQIAEQEKIVAKLAEALEQAKKEYADNQEVQDKWQIKLNSARTVLANMKNSLESTNDSIKNFGVAMKDLPADTGNAVQGVVDLGSAMEKVIGIAGKIKDAVKDSFTGLVDNLKEISSEAWSLMTSTMATIENWKGIQDAYGGDVEQIQDFFTITKMADIDTSVLTGGIQKLVTKTHNGDKATKELLKSWGLDESQFSSHWDYFVAVWEKLQSMKDESAQFDAASTLFGDKSAGDIFTLLSKWNTAKSAYGERVAGSGLSLTGSTIDSIDEAYAKLVQLETTFDAFKTKIGSELILNFGLQGDIETLQDILSDVSKIFFGTDSESAEAKASLVVDIQTLFSNLTGGIGNVASWLGELQQSLSESEDPTVKAIANLMGSLQKLLQWIADHADTIITLLTKWIEFKAKDLGVELTTGRSIEEWASTAGEIGKSALQLGVMAKLLGGSAGGAAAAGGASLISGAGAVVGSVAPFAFPVAASAAMMPLFIDGIGRTIKEYSDFFDSVRNNNVADTFNAQEEYGDGRMVGKAWDYFEETAEGDIEEYENNATDAITEGIKSAAALISGAVVQMDGQTVGNLIIPYIDAGLAK